MKPFVINKHGRLVFPATVLGELDFSVMHTLDQFTAVIGRDFESKAPTGTDIRKKVETGAYTDRFSLLRDLGQNLFWVNRYSMTMFDKRPTRWRDLPRRRSDVFLPVLTPWEDGEAKVAAVERAWKEPAAHLGRHRRAGDLRPALRPLPAQAPPRHRAARGQADRGRVPRAPRRAHLGGARARSGLPRLRPHRDPRRRGPRARARGAAAVGDGAAQPVPVGPLAHPAAAGRRRSATTTG